MTSKLRVQRVLMSSGVESATVVRADDVVECVDRFLAHLTAIERSPNTVRAYAHDLRDFVAFLDSRPVAWDAVSLEDIGKFVGWLDGSRCADHLGALVQRKTVAIVRRHRASAAS